MKVSKKGGYRAFIAALVVANVGAGAMIATDAFAGEGEGEFGCNTGTEECWCTPMSQICTRIEPEEPKSCKLQSDCKPPKPPE